MKKRELLLAITSLLPIKIRNILIILFYKKPQYNEDGILTFHYSHFQIDPPFKKSRDISLKATGHGGGIDWRLHTVLWAAKQCIRLEGDFIECGTDTGFLARAIVEYVKFKNVNKKFYLVDTFEGIPVEYTTEREKKINYHTQSYKYQGSYERIKKTFANFKNVIIVKGKIPDVLPLINSDKVAFISIDLNNAYPEIESGKYFWDKVVDGGMIVLDDYSYSDTYIEQRIQWDKLAKKLNFDILTLATGQGLIIKNSHIG